MGGVNVLVEDAIGSVWMVDGGTAEGWGDGISGEGVACAATGDKGVAFQSME
jgi:hypothetical protein